MGFSLVVEGLLKSHVPDTTWAPLITKFGYSLGFLIVILGRQQLFTEQTLTAILPMLARDRHSGRRTPLDRGAAGEPCRRRRLRDVHGIHAGVRP